jgi:hypothetical protein
MIATEKTENRNSRAGSMEGFVSDISREVSLNESSVKSAVNRDFTICQQSLKQYIEIERKSTIVSPGGSYHLESRIMQFCHNCQV